MRKIGLLLAATLALFAFSCGGAKSSSGDAGKETVLERELTPKEKWEKALEGLKTDLLSDALYQDALKAAQTLAALDKTGRYAAFAGTFLVRGQ